jgi:uncharacterized Zn finger protein (UPF0148 family)
MSGDHNMHQKGRITCPRCGKDNPAEIHTCTPKALVLAGALDHLVILDEVGSNNPLAKDAAAELRLLHTSNEQLREQNTELDRIASELQDTCHKQAKKMAEYEALLQQALATLEDVFGKNKVDVGIITAIKERLG